MLTNTLRMWLAFLLKAVFAMKIICCIIFLVAYQHVPLLALLTSEPVYGQFSEKKRDESLDWVCYLVRGLIWLVLASSSYIQRTKWENFLVLVWWVTFSVVNSALNVPTLVKTHKILRYEVQCRKFSGPATITGPIISRMRLKIAAFVPLMYMCIGTYYSLFKIGTLMFYSFTPRQTISVSLLMICSMVARYAPPVSYNFLNVIRLERNAKTIFEKWSHSNKIRGIMGSIGVKKIAGCSSVVVNGVYHKFVAADEAFQMGRDLAYAKLFEWRYEVQC